MRTAAKIFLILNLSIFLIAILLVIWSLITLGFQSFEWISFGYLIIFALASVPSIVMDFIALKELSYKYRKPSIAISVLTLIFSNLISGILMICIPDPQEQTPNKNNVERSSRADHSNDKQKSIYGMPICQKCGKRDDEAKHYEIVITRCLCPECKAKYDEQQNQAR